MIAIGLLLPSVLLSDCEPTLRVGVLFGLGVVILEEEEHARLDTGVEQFFDGVGSIPVPDWKVRQLIALKSFEGDGPYRAGPCGLTRL